MADEIRQGVNPSNAITFGVCVTGRPADLKTADYVVVKDAEGLNMQINNEIQTWNPMDQEGWERALTTAKAITISFGGKRNSGDPGNDYVASRAFKNGQDCNSALKVTFPDGDALYVPCVIDVKTRGGNSVDIDSLSWDAKSDGKPEYVPYTPGA